ncbi:MAG TPA: hypothetical protein VH414_19160 [Lichenihabitans sp.]|nr:hypothetical protein [Lichenihabitans sp.]
MVRGTDDFADTWGLSRRNATRRCRGAEMSRSSRPCRLRRLAKSSRWWSSGLRIESGTAISAAHDDDDPAIADRKPIRTVVRNLGLSLRHRRRGAALG